MPTNQTNEQMAQWLEELANRWNAVANSWAADAAAQKDDSRYLLDAAEMEAACRQDSSDIKAGAAALRQVDALAAEGARLREALLYAHRAIEASDGEDCSEVNDDLIAPAIKHTPTTAAWLAAHDAEVRRAALEEFADWLAEQVRPMNGSDFCLGMTEAMRACRSRAAQPAKEGA